jgi:tetratricopeptide (TPR) repeat protein
MLSLFEEGIREAKEALEIMERVGGTTDRAKCLESLANSLLENKQLDAAEDAISGAINLWEEDQQFNICRSHQTLGQIYRRKGEREKAVQNFEVALGIASRFEWHNQIFWIHHYMTWLFCTEDELDDAQSHITQAKLHVVDDKYCLGNAMGFQAWIWLKQGRVEDAMSEALGAKEIFEKLGAVMDLGNVRGLIEAIEEEMESRATAVASDSIGESQ